VGAHCSRDLFDGNTYYHVQEWRSRRELDAHLNSPLFSALLGLKTILTESPQVDLLQRD
jgi:quinol monooxygenase YgiN